MPSHPDVLKRSEISKRRRLTFSDIAVLVTHIHETYFELSSSSKFPIPVISSNLDIKTFHSYVSNAAKERDIKEVKVYKVDYRQNFIIGRFQMYQDRAEVLISTDANTCWGRYVAAKEMSHIIVDKTKESMTTDIDRTITWMLQQGMCSNIHASLDSEHVAAQFAAELLVPYNMSKPMLEDNAISSYQIASYFGVPERIIDTFRDQGYSALRDEAYKDI